MGWLATCWCLGVAWVGVYECELCLGCLDCGGLWFRLLLCDVVGFDYCCFV